jgi:hypothetical protein
MKEILVGKLMDISQQVSPALLLGVCVGSARELWWVNQE